MCYFLTWGIQKNGGQSRKKKEMMLLISMGLELERSLSLKRDSGNISSQVSDWALVGE
jgi:hypothetical protein